MRIINSLVFLACTLFATSAFGQGMIINGVYDEATGINESLSVTVTALDVFLQGGSITLPPDAATETTLAIVETNTDYGTTVGPGTEAGALRVTLPTDGTGMVGTNLTEIAGVPVEHTGGHQTVYSHVQSIGAVNVNLFDANGVGVYQDVGSLRTVAYDVAGAVRTLWDVASTQLPAVLGQGTMAQSMTVAIASNQSDLPITAAALPLPALAATSTLQLPDGHNTTNDNAAGGAAVNVQDGGNVITVDGTVTADAGTNLNTSALALSATQTDGTQKTQIVDAAGHTPDVLDEKLRTLSMPYDYAVMEGIVPGHSQFGSFGSREAVAVVTQGSDVWNGVATTIPYPVDAGEQLEIISTSVEDDPDKGGAVAGTGVHTVVVHYLDAAGAPQEETIDLNGLAAVALTETNVRFVQVIHSEMVGTVGAAVGIVTLYKQGVAGTVYSEINIGTNISMSTMMMVPAGKTLYITQGFASAADKSVDIRLRATAHGGVLYPDIFIAAGVGSLNDSTMVRHPRIVLPALTKVKMTCYVPATKAGADVSGGWGGWIE